MVLRYFLLQLRFSASAFMLLWACTKWGASFHPPDLSPRSAYARVNLISHNSALALRNTGVNSQEVLWILERLTGLWILIQVTTRYKLYRHLMNEGLPLNESVSQSPRGNHCNMVLGVCEGTVKWTHFMRLQHVCRRYMQPALYS